jgi:flavin reductase (DIM6/NTAB) family NADH-FMN oxidoreductase RutF
MIKGAIVSAECKVVSHIDLETNTLFIAEIKEAWSQDKFISNKHIDYKNTGALILTMPDNHYSLIGDSVAKAWKVGLIK